MPQSPESTFGQPQRQSPAALFVLLLKTAGIFLKVMWPAVVVILFSNSDKQDGASRIDRFTILLGVFTVISLVVAVFKYFFYRFYISNDSFIVKSGWLTKKVTSIPLQNITAVHLDQNLVHRILQVAKVSLDSAGSEKVEVSIDALSLKKADELKRFLLSNTIQQTNVQTDYAAPDASSLSMKDLLVLSLTSNHIEAFFILLALSVNAWNDIGDFINLDESKWIEENASILQSSVFITALIILAVAFISIAYSIIRTFLKYYDFSIITESKGWKIAHGLTNHQQKFLPFSKVQVLQWHSNFVRRKFNIWIMHFLSSGNSEVKKKQKIQVPVFSFQSAGELVRHYQESQILHPAEANSISKSYWWRGLLYFIIPFGLIPSVVVLFWLPWFSILWSLIFVYIAVHKFYFRQNFKWQVNHEGLQVYSGVWGRKYSVMKWNKVQHVSMTQNLYQKKRALSSITFITAGGTILLPYISKDNAHHIVNQVLFLLESKNETWL